jgi:purine-binding chemotaxis protein CheW
MNQLVKVPGATPSGASAALAAVEEKQYLTFLLGTEMFSLDILCIKEIIWYAGLTEVPMMPACIRGVINLRGAVVPVMDLSARFGRASGPVGKSTCIVITEVESADGDERQNMGIVVDAVQAVLEIPAAEIEPPPSFGAKIRSDFIEGIAKVNGKFVIVLNVQRVLSAEEIGAMGHAAALAEVATA